MPLVPPRFHQDDCHSLSTACLLVVSVIVVDVPYLENESFVLVPTISMHMKDVPAMRHVTIRGHVSESRIALDEAL